MNKILAQHLIYWQGQCVCDALFKGHETFGSNVKNIVIRVNESCFKV
jgi:hypothetical protein